MGGLKAVLTAAAASGATGLALLLDTIPQDIGKLGVLVSMFVAVAALAVNIWVSRVRVKLERLEIEKHIRDRAAYDPSALNDNPDIGHAIVEAFAENTDQPPKKS